MVLTVHRVLMAQLVGVARAVLVLYDVEGWTHDEIATHLGMAVGSSKAQLHRARVTTVYETLERPLVPVLAEMEMAGIKVE